MEREHRVARRRRVVVEILLPRDERLAVDRRQEEAAVHVVGEEIDRKQREPVRLVQPAELAGRDMQLVEPVRDVRVVLEVAGPLRDAVSPGSVQPLAVGERAEQELGELARGVEPVVALEPPPRFRERGEHEPVPGGDRLVVAQRLRPLLPHREQPRALVVGELAAQDVAPVLEREQELRRGRSPPGVQVKVSPSTPSVSASCAEAKPPPSRRSSRSAYSTVCSTTLR